MCTHIGHAIDTGEPVDVFWRNDTDPARPAIQAALRQTGTPRSTPILATVEGVIWDGTMRFGLPPSSAKRWTFASLVCRCRPRA